MGKMRTRNVLIPLGFACIALGVAAALAGPRIASRTRTAEIATRRTTLDTRLADFREDEDASRVVAALEAVLEREAGRAVLSIRASATGPRVVPPPGAEALSGSNAIAARELASILTEGRAEVRITGPAGSASRGRAIAGRREEILKRRLLPDGRVEHVPAGGVARAAEAVFEAPLASDGRYRVEVVVDGHVRAQATCTVEGERGRVTSLEGVAEHGTPGGRP